MKRFLILMRRATMTGVPQKNSLSIGGRATLTEDPRKKQRNVREKTFQLQCINVIMDFLGTKEFERVISVETLANPSLKDFQGIFKFIYYYIDPTAEFSRKFEEEVIFFLKGIKYPYASEINRSQLIAITPHTWPVLLAMLAWMVSLAQSMEEVQFSVPEEKGIEEESRDIFYHYLYREYSAYMEGRDGDESGEKGIEKAISEINQEKVKKAEECQSTLERLKKEISSIDNTIKDIEEVEEKKSQIVGDLEKLAGLKKHNEIRQKKYRKSLEESQSILEKLLEEAAYMHKKKTELEEEIKMQPIKPEDVAEMVEERDTLLKSTEELKKAKTMLIRETENLNGQIKNTIEEAEKLLFDLSSIPSQLDIKLRISKKRVQTDLLEYDEYEVEGDIEQEHTKAKETLQSLTEESARAEEALSDEKEKNSSLQDKQKFLADDIISKEERIKVHAQVYIEKKEASEEEYRRAVGRVDKAETELLKILADGDNGLFQSEQNLERLKIKKGRTASKIAAEEAELQRIKALVSANMQSLQERVQEAYLSLSSPHS